MSVTSTLAMAFLLQTGSLPAADSASARIDSAGTARALAHAYVADFLSQWRSAWLATATAQSDTVRDEHFRTFAFARRGLPVDAPPDSLLATRLVAVHCHLDGGSDLWTILPFARRIQIIGTRESAHGVCPLWRLDKASADGDESLDLDAALDPMWRAHITQSRAQLLTLLDSLAAIAPADDFIVGQRVRFAVQLGDTTRIAASVEGCRGTAWWCTALAGYVLGARRPLMADSLFALAEARMPPAARCAWQDASVLLPPSARTEYVALDCDARERATARLWWLADPLHGTPGNSRLTEHRGRLVRVLLHAALDQDERYDWRRTHGGGALREALVRYGWPSFAWWAGTRTDTSHSAYLTGVGAPPTRPYATFEYNRDRLHLVPAWRAIADPFTAEPSDLSVAAAPADPRSTWWPSEHAALDRPLCELADQQVAVLRRQRTVLVAAAAPLACQVSPSEAGGRMTASLVLSSSPDDFTIAARRTGEMGSTVALAGEIVPRPLILSLEIVPADASTSPALRMRMGLMPPAALSVMRPGSLAISAPLLFTADAKNTPPTDADGAIARMLGSLRLTGRRAIGVYWETYNAAPSDSLDVGVRIERAVDVGPLRKLAGALGLVGEARAPTAVKWRESAVPAEPAGSGAPPVPIRPRAIVLDISALKPGDYWVQVEVSKPGGTRLTSRRLVTVVTR